MSILLTIGYEGANVEDFIATLKRAEVEVLIDIRDVPVSRKRGFSKKPLAELLESSGVRYVHLRDLGDPKPGREAAKRGDMPTFQRIFRTHLQSHGAQEALGRALDISAAARTCLLCFERDHSSCHRAIVAEAMGSRESVKVRHIDVRHGIAEVTDHDDLGNGRVYAVG